MDKNEKSIEINKYIFRGYDIRGIAGEDLSYDIIKKISRGYAGFLKQRRIKEIVVGHDCRLTGKEYKKAFIAGMMESSINVIDIGMCLTQMVYFAQYYFQANASCMLTASHNPKEYNGMKLGYGYSSTLGTEEIEELKEIIDKNNFVNDGVPGEVRKENIQEPYLKDLIKRVDVKGLTDKKEYKIVIDASNGTTGEIAPALFEKLGFKVIRQNCEIDGNFPNGTPDPTEEHLLKRLGQRVKEEKAQLGVAYDGDGDRLGVVDENGRSIWADVLLSIFAKDILKHLPESKIVYNVLCSKMVDEVITQNGGKPIIYKTGHSFIKKKAMVENAVFGGELSGHFFFIDNFYGHDDALFATLRLLEFLKNEKKDLSTIIDEFPVYISSPEIKISCPDEVKFRVVDKEIFADLKKAYPDGIFTTIDGVRVDFPDSMLVVRCSQNGPYITVKFEAKDEVRYNEIKQKLNEILHSYKEIIWQEGVNLEALK